MDGMHQYLSQWSHQLHIVGSENNECDDNIRKTSKSNLRNRKHYMTALKISIFQNAESEYGDNDKKSIDE